MMSNVLDLRSIDPKEAARQLRAALKDRRIDLSHGECLDIVARELGLRDWNVLAARLAGKAPASTRLAAPPGWSLRGQHLGEFTGGLDRDDTHLGKPVFWLRNDTEFAGSAVLLQQIAADRFAGRRLRFSGWIRADSVEHFASIGMAAHDRNGRSILFNNLEHLPVNGALRGTMPWSRRAIVKVIPADAASIEIDAALVGRGEARFADLKLEIVGPEVPETPDSTGDAPANLDFAALG